MKKYSLSLLSEFKDKTMEFYWDEWD